MLGLGLGSEFPNFVAETTAGKISFHEWLGDSWGMLFSHPSDFTPVCTTELSRVLQLLDEFKKRNVKVIGLSCDSVESHIKWAKDIQSYAGCFPDKFPYPLIDDQKRDLAVKLGMLDPDEKDAEGLPLTCRAVFLIDPAKRLRLSLLYPATTGRNFSEILRAVDSIMLTSKHKVATPVDWKQGDDCMILPTVSDEEAQQLFPGGIKYTNVPSGKAYIRSTPMPKDSPV